MAIRWDKFTVKAQEAVQRASQLASEHGNPELQPVHLLLAMTTDEVLRIKPQNLLTGLPVRDMEAVN